MSAGRVRVAAGRGREDMKKKERKGRKKVGKNRLGAALFEREKHVTDRKISDPQNGSPVTKRGLKVMEKKFKGIQMLNTGSGT